MGVTINKLDIRKTMIILAVLYFATTLINYEFNKENRFTGVRFSLPHLYSGDQPHYYVVLYSMLKDHDLDIKNNYDYAEFNLSSDAGHLFKGQHLFREAVYSNPDGGDYIPLWVMNTTSQQFVEMPSPGTGYGLITDRPMGMPLLYYLLMLPFSLVDNPEPIVIYLSVIFVLSGLYFFYLILNHLLNDEKLSSFFVLLAGTSTAAWLYSRLFYPDVVHFFLLSLIFYLFIVKKSNLMVGILFGIGASIRPTFVIVLPLFMLYRFFCHGKQRTSSKDRLMLIIKNNLKETQSYKSALMLILPVVLVFFAQSYYNYHFFGGFANNPSFEVLKVRNPLIGIFISFFKLDRGLLIFSPVLLFALFGIKNFYNRQKMESLLVYGVIAVNILFFSSTLINWRGLDTYSIRYYLPILPYFFIPMAFWYKKASRNPAEMKYTRFWIVLFYVLAAVSIIINTQAAFFNPLVWNGPPWKIISLFFKHF